MDLETYKNIQAIALAAVEKPDYEAFYRRVCRYYSSKFATPLHLVEEMADEYVLQHYFEQIWGEIYAESENEEVAKQYDRIKQTVLHEEAQEDEVEVDDEEWVKEMLQNVQKEAENGAQRILTETEKLMQSDLWGADKFVEGEGTPDWET